MNEERATAAGPIEAVGAGTPREELGDFSSVVCSRAIITGMEDLRGATHDLFRHEDR